MSTSDNPSFEEAITNLDAIVRQLESGALSLEESIKVYEEGIKLKKFCETTLKQAKVKIDQITLNEEGEAQIVPFETSQK